MRFISSNPKQIDGKWVAAFRMLPDEGYAAPADDAEWPSDPAYGRLAEVAPSHFGACCLFVVESNGYGISSEMTLHDHAFNSWEDAYLFGHKAAFEAIDLCA